MLICHGRRAFLIYDHDFDRINRHRGYAELVAHNRNWLPWWLVTSITGDFCDQAERYLRGDGLPPFPVRLWWAFRHWRFQRKNRPTYASALHKKHFGPKKNLLTPSNFKAGGLIPVAPGQRVECVPVAADPGHHEISVLDMKSGERRKIRITPQMLKDIRNPLWDRIMPEVSPDMRLNIWSSEEGDFGIDSATVDELKKHHSHGGFTLRASDLGSFPRPNCSKCHTPGPTLGTPLNDKTESGWGNSYFTCGNHRCRHTWTWRKTFPGLEENSNRAGTVSGTVLKGTKVPFFLHGELTVTEVNDVVSRLSKVAGIENFAAGAVNQMCHILADTVRAGHEVSNKLAILTNQNAVNFLGHR